MGSLFRPHKLACIPWFFKLDDSSLLGGNIEGCCIGLCFVQTVCNLLWDALLGVSTRLCIL